MDLGRVGIWSSQLRYGSDPGAIRDAAAELDGLGFGALWFPGGMGGDVLGDARRLLEATRTAVVATGILNVWSHDPAEVAAGHAALTAAFPGRFLLGIGVSHAPAVERMEQTYEHPLAKMRGYLDALDAAATPVPPAERALAALGPKMLELAADRSRGAHPYLVTPEHSAFARGILGPAALLAPEQKIVFATDAAEARAIARTHLALYLQLPNYTNNWMRLGFEPADLDGGGSDRLVDALVAWGSEEAIAARVQSHLDAGADHVCVQVLTADRAEVPRAEWRRLAGAVLQ